MNVKNTLRVSAGVTILFLVLITSVVFFVTRQINEAIEKGRSADSIVKKVFDLNSLTDEYLAHPGERIAVQWDLVHTDIAALLEAQEGNTDEERQLLMGLKENHHGIGITFKGSIAQEGDMTRLLPLRERQAAQLKINAQAMVRDATSLAALNFEEQESSRTLAVTLLITLTLLFSASIVATIILLYRRITGPLTELHHGTDRIAGGDLNFRLDIRTRDEFGQVANSFNQMTDRLEDLYRNITKRASTAEEVVKAQKEFIAVLSHELRNPLAAISTTAELIRLRGYLKSGEGHKSLDVIHRQVQIMIKLVDDLLHASRVIQGKITIEKKISDLNPVINDAVATIKQKVEKKRQILEVRLSPSPLPVSIDPIRIEQVIANLLDNAVKFTPENGLIQIRTEKRDSDAVVSMVDNGIGISEEDVSLVFEAFVQTNDISRGEDRGIGLGLKISKTLVEMHGGKISLKSRGKGQGSEFEIRLPLVA